MCKVVTTLKQQERQNNKNQITNKIKKTRPWRIEGRRFTDTLVSPTGRKFYYCGKSGRKSPAVGKRKRFLMIYGQLIKPSQMTKGKR